MTAPQTQAYIQCTYVRFSPSVTDPKRQIMAIASSYGTRVIEFHFEAAGRAAAERQRAAVSVVLHAGLGGAGHHLRADEPGPAARDERGGDPAGERMAAMAVDAPRDTGRREAVTMRTLNTVDVDALLEAAALVSGGDMIIIVTGRRLSDDGFSDLRTYTLGTSGHEETTHILRHVGAQPAVNSVHWPDDR